MLSLHPEFVVDAHQNRKAVLLAFDEWERVVTELEELDDIRLYDAATRGGREAIPFEQAVRRLDGVDDA
ncbi:MAG: hypothetical protein OXC12_19990 [Spirochaetaceae bacterium]|nr:hypothetical protein [Spirochaetaceae bacterium]